MPIYEYFCNACQGKFRHLARKIHSPTPACPRCGNAEVKRMISSAHTLHSQTHHTQELRQEAGHVDTNNTAEIAQFLKDSGRMDDTDGLYGSKAYRELLDRRADGASDQDLSDLVDDLAAEMRMQPGGEVSGALIFSEKMENRMAAESPPDDIDPELEDKKTDITQRKSRPAKRHVEDLGWV